MSWSSVKVTPPVLTVTVAVLVSPLSAIVDRSTVTCHTGASSSVMVSLSSGGAETPSALTAPATVTCLSGVCTELSTAVTVTVPLLSVALAAKLSVVLSLSLKSLSVSGSGSVSTGAAVTVTVTVNGSVAAGATVAVTRLTPPSSAISCSDSSSDTIGVPSSSMIVTVG